MGGEDRRELREQGRRRRRVLLGVALDLVGDDVHSSPPAPRHSSAIRRIGGVWSVAQKTNVAP